MNTSYRGLMKATYRGLMNSEGHIPRVPLVPGRLHTGEQGQLVVECR